MSKPKPSVSPTPSSAAMEAARSFELGGLRQTIPIYKFPALRERVIGRAHEFDYGFVRHLDGHEPEACRLDQVDTVYWSATRSEDALGNYKFTQYSIVLKCSDGRGFKLAGYCKDPAAKRKADPQDVHYRLYELLVRVRDGVSAMLLPGAIAALDRGEQLAFGDFKIDARGIQAPKGYVAWSSVKEVSASLGLVSIRQEHKFFPVSMKKVGQIPNVPLFLILAETLRRQAAGNGSAYT